MTVKIGMISLGCAKNLVNSEQMMYLLDEAGFLVTGDIVGADVVIVNTCGFIEHAKTEAIETIIELGKDKKEGKIGKLIVTGCLAERYKDEIISELPEIDAVVGVGSFAEIVGAVVSSLEGDNPAVFGDINAPVDESDRVITTSPMWTYLKIAEGCDNRCAFCVIPDIRGRFRSRPMEKIVDEAINLAARGIKELIIVAQDVTRYGLDLYGKRCLAQLLTRLCAIDGIRWIRLHYLYPDEIDDSLIEIIANNDKILKYLDIPIQHVCDGILQKMRRRGTGGEIRELFSRLRERIPGVVLRTSLITGLPGENDTEFDELCNFLQEAKIERAGVFAYSPEEGTDAAEMDRPNEEIAVRRAELVERIQTGIMDEFNLNRVGSVTEVLVEGQEDDYYYGRSYAESPEIDGVIYINGENIVVNSFIPVRITGVENGEPIGVPV